LAFGGLVGGSDGYRAVLHVLNTDQRRRLIEAAREHFADRLTDDTD
jgi:hypothetical protein